MATSPACSPCQALGAQTPRSTSETQPLSHPKSPAELSWGGPPSMQALEGNLCGDGWEERPSWFCPLLSEHIMSEVISHAPSKGCHTSPASRPTPNQLSKCPVSSDWSLALVGVAPVREPRLSKVTGSLQPVVACVKPALVVACVKPAESNCAVCQVSADVVSQT